MSLLARPGSSIRDRVASEDWIWCGYGIVVVADRQPVVRDHLLIVATAPAASLAALDHDLVEAALAGATEERGTEFLLAERGRAPFCTSDNGEHQAHAHLFPLKELNEFRSGHHLVRAR